MRLRVVLAAVLAFVSCGALTTIVLAEKKDDGRSLRVTLRNADGAAVGTVTMTAPSATAAVKVSVRVRRQTPSFHGFHVHAVGTCEGPTFMSAGGHLGAGATSHGTHPGDMPSLLVKRNRTATLSFTTDGFKIGDLRDRDGSAVIVHATADNFANIPPRYAPNGPDQATLDTGDSGGRVACGRIAPAS
jgi:Cu-Zn family superoxide dismutase